LSEPESSAEPGEIGIPHRDAQREGSVSGGQARLRGVQDTGLDWASPRPCGSFFGVSRRGRLGQELPRSSLHRAPRASTVCL